MARLTHKKKEDIGLSPYAAVFRGEKKMEAVHIKAVDFDLNDIDEFDIHSAEQMMLLKKNKKISWINVDGLHDTEKIQLIANVFNIPGNIVSDILNPSTRPKLQEFDDGVFITIKVLKMNRKTKELSSENLSIILTDGTIISFQERRSDLFDPIHERLRRSKNKIRSSGADYLAFAMLDIVIDNYIYIIGLMGDHIENLDDIMSDDPELVNQINFYKRELNFLRKNVKPAKEMILTFVKCDSDYIDSENRNDFKELQDNINEAIELSDSYREILYDQLNMYHTIMGMRLNDVMKILTVFSVIFIPITFIVGVYGTNFDYIPELKWKHGYWIMWFIIIFIVVFMLWYFRRKKWF